MSSRTKDIRRHWEGVRLCLNERLFLSVVKPTAAWEVAWVHANGEIEVELEGIASAREAFKFAYRCFRLALLAAEATQASKACGCYACNDGSKLGHFLCSTPEPVMLAAEQAGFYSRQLDSDGWHWIEA